MKTRSTRRGFSLPEVCCSLFATVLLTSIALPALAAGNSASLVDRSMTNLRSLHFAHVLYAFDWNGRQFTLVDDEITTFGTSPNSAFNNYYHENGGESEADQHPASILGWTASKSSGDFVLFAYRTHGGGFVNVANCGLLIPFGIGGNPSVERTGSSRLWNVRQFNQYVSGRFYDETFYAPQDDIVNDTVLSLLDESYEYVDGPTVPGAGDIPAWAGYSLSASAMFDPSIFRSPSTGGVDKSLGNRRRLGIPKPRLLSCGVCEPQDSHA